MLGVARKYKTLNNLPIHFTISKLIIWVFQPETLLFWFTLAALINTMSSNSIVQKNSAYMHYLQCETVVMFPSNCQANFKRTFKMSQKRKKKENVN